MLEEVVSMNSKVMRKNSLIILLLCLILICVWFYLPHKIIVQNDEKNYHPQIHDPAESCGIKKYPNEAKVEWEIICFQMPYIENTLIKRDVEQALLEVGFLCAGFPYPKAEEINKICKDYVIK